MTTQFVEKSKLGHCNNIQKDIDTALECLGGYKPLLPVETSLNKTQLRFAQYYLQGALNEIEHLLKTY